MSESKQKNLKRAMRFIPEVREEVGKVVWPSRRETMLTTWFVFVFAVVAAIYFMLVDTVIHKTINWIIDTLAR